MGFRVTYLPDWIHVEFQGNVDAFDVIEHVKDGEFWDRLSEVKTVLYDYSKASNVEMSLDDTKGFAALARVQANLVGPVQVIVLIAGPDRLENALAYKNQSESQDWHVKIATTMDEAESMLNKTSSE